MKHLMTKLINKDVFPAVTKNLNWEILNKSLVTLKRWDGLRMKNMGFHWKIQFLGGSRKTNI